MQFDWFLYESDDYELIKSLIPRVEAFLPEGWEIEIVSKDNNHKLYAVNENIRKRFIANPKEFIVKN